MKSLHFVLIFAASAVSAVPMADQVAPAVVPEGAVRPADLALAGDDQVRPDPRFLSS